MAPRLDTSRPMPCCGSGVPLPMTPPSPRRQRAAAPDSQARPQRWQRLWLTRPCVVEVQIEDRWTGVGVHVGRGRFLTKAGELSGRVSMILADGTVAATEIAARDPATDLALL